ncbi:thioester reductase domain-containing protein [Prochlorothrix hollandica]|uniref:thioester reductase domain-containing protein n=1 Tax=Prochlorothrix hollandica TaxID=1223 RepID=UPI0003462BED|nr:thioester reductase domain-containing protein [Prochlorothrix hollandica]
MTLNLPAEALLDPTIQFHQPLAAHATQPRQIFLTGSTGFLGAFLLEALLTQTDTLIHCLVRGDDPQVGRERLVKHLSFYRIWQPVWNDRLILVMGDLRQPCLGLEAAAWDHLAQVIDTIYHGAAQVNSAVSYEVLRPINVLGTQEVLRLASVHHTKPVHFVSTMAVFINPQQPLDHPVLETDVPQLAGLKGGYKQSKWVAEGLVRSAQDRGLPACIHRPARIMGDSRTGINGNMADFLCSLIKGCILFGKIPNPEAVINLMPVDYVAQAMVHLAHTNLATTPPWGKTFNLMNPQFIPWREVGQQVRSLGYVLEEVSLEEWMAALQQRISEPAPGDRPHLELYGSLLLLLTSPLNLFSPKPPISLAQTSAGLAGSGITCPPVDVTLMGRYLAHFQETGYLPRPDRQFASPEPSPEPSPKAPTAFWKGIRSNMRSQQVAFRIRPVSRDQSLALSFGQERLWAIEQLQPGNPVHNLRAVFRLRGPLDIPALERSLQEIVRRQEVLRTGFPALEGQPVLKIWPEVPLALPVENLEHLSATEQEAAIVRIAAAAAQEPFDLAQPPLMRVKLLRLSPTDHALLRTVHHIINDVWSDTVRLRELASLYTAFSQGQPSPLPDLKVQYADFAQAQRHWLQGEVLQQQVNYWETQLARPLALLRLPVDHAPTLAPTYRGAAELVTIPEAVTAGLKALAQTQGVTLFTVLLAAYKMLLNRYSGQTDLILCSPVASRKQPATKQLLGYFSNIVLVRSHLDGNPSFRTVIDRVSHAVLGAFDHNDLPFQQLVEDLRLPGVFLSRAMFTLQNVPPQPKELAPGVSLQLQAMEEGLSNFDLSLSVKENGDGLVGVFRYQTDLFEAATIASLGHNFQQFLETLLADPDRPLQSLPPFAPFPENPDQSPQSTVPYVEPETDVQRSIARLWQGVLKIDRVGLDDNFFDLGGRSLAMIQVYVQLKTQFPGDLAVPDLFKRPTVRGMADYLQDLT